MYVFLGLNGWRIVAEEPEVVRLMVDAAGGGLDEGVLAGWLRERRVAAVDPVRTLSADA